MIDMDFEREEQCDICKEWKKERMHSVIMLDDVTKRKTWFDICFLCLNKYKKYVIEHIEPKNGGIEMAEKRKFKEVEQTKFHNFTEEESVEGTLVDIKKGEYGKQPVLQLDDGSKVTLPSKTVLENKISEDLVGKYIKVTYLGEEQSKKNKKWKYEDFKVEVAE